MQGPVYRGLWTGDLNFETYTNYVIYLSHPFST